MHSDAKAVHAGHLPPSSDVVHAPVLTAVLHPDPLTASDISGIFGQFDNRHSLADPNERTAVEVAADASLDLVLFEQARHDRSGSPLGRADHLRVARAKVLELTADLDRLSAECGASWASDLAALLVRIDGHLTRALALAASETSRKPSRDQTSSRSVRPSRRQRWSARRILAAQRISVTTALRVLARAIYVAIGTAHLHLPHASDPVPTLVACLSPAAAPGAPNAPPRGSRAVAA